MNSLAMKNTICVLMMLLCMTLALCPAWAESDDPVVVRVGEVTFTKSQLQSALDSDILFSEVLSRDTLTDEEKAAQREDTINRFIGVGLIECKLIEAGKNDFTPEEEENLKSAARNQYEQLWQGLYQRAQGSSEDVTEAQITEFMEDEGYTVEAIYDEYLASERRYRAVELFCPPITLTEDMVMDYYKTSYLDPDRERYENNLDLYEQEILAQKNESFYTPAGYRAIKQILLAYPEEVDKALKNELAAVNTAGQTMAQALQALTAAATSAEGWDDMIEPRAAYDAAYDELIEAKKVYDDKRMALTEPLIKDTVDEIKAAFDAGIDFGSLIDKYSTDKNEQNTDKGGYPVHPDSKNWPENFLSAAVGLEKPRDITEPVYTDMGIHILYYASDIPEGDHELTPDERETLNASAEYYYQNQELEKLIAEWRGDYEIETHPELLDD